MTTTLTVKDASGSSTGMSKSERRVLAGTLAGTSIEWYEFFIYAMTAAMIFGHLYFEPLVAESPILARVVAFASIGISFLFRPLGAVIAGHLGDRIGRKKILVITLLLMGGATMTMGLLPTYAQIGFWAPILLILLRILQGLSAGGEWGGAALMAVEHAPKSRRALFGAYPQVGVPVGMLLASLAVTGVTLTVGNEAYLAWGWRIPFLLSVILLAIGFVIRRAVGESPVFTELQERRQESSAPLKTLFTKYPKTVLKAALIFMGSNAAGWLLIAYISSYATNTLGMDRTGVLAATSAAAVAWIGTTLWSGYVADRIGRTKTFKIGYVAIIIWMIPLFLLIDTRNVWLLALATMVLAFGVGFAYGPLSVLYAEMFPVEVRYSGVSIGYAIGTILGGAFAPMVAEILMTVTKWSPAVGIYIIVLCAVSLLAVFTVRDQSGRDLGVKPARTTEIPAAVP